MLDECEENEYTKAEAQEVMVAKKWYHRGAMRTHYSLIFQLSRVGQCHTTYGEWGH